MKRPVYTSLSRLSTKEPWKTTVITISDICKLPDHKSILTIIISWLWIIYVFITTFVCFTICPRSSGPFYIVTYYIEWGHYCLDIQYYPSSKSKHGENNEKHEHRNNFLIVYILLWIWHLCTYLTSLYYKQGHIFMKLDISKSM